MGTALMYISLAVVLIVVLVLVVYLLGIIVALSRARRNLYQLAEGLDAIVKDTQPLPGKLSTINGALGQLLAGLQAVDGDLAVVARIFGR
jgi:uncharacterized protein YoxC